jgi:hypothetical protein
MAIKGCVMSKTSDPENGHALKGMWINPKSNLNRESGKSEWRAEADVPGDPQTARNLELTDAPLRLKGPIRMRAKAAAAGTYQTGAKTEPYYKLSSGRKASCDLHQHALDNKQKKAGDFHP